jgi:hypothetical protein
MGTRIYFHEPSYEMQSAYDAWRTSYSVLLFALTTAATLLAIWKVRSWEVRAHVLLPDVSTIRIHRAHRR